MDFESSVDPRYGPLPPAPEEIENWAVAERRRRKAWLTGPTEQEKEAWAQRARRRALLGFSETRLAPSREDIDQWAAREHQRRQAWSSGPTENEKQDWLRRTRRRTMTGMVESELPPTPEDLEEWTTREKQRRQEWLDGPTSEEKSRWARREGGGLWEALMVPPAIEGEIVEVARRFLRDAELAGKGSLFALSRAPLAFWSFLLRSGRAFEEEFSEQPSRTRVRF
jgi:hypothetical protein